MNIKKLSPEKLKTIIKTLRFMAKEDITKIIWKREPERRDIFMLDWRSENITKGKAFITLNSLYLYKDKDE